MLSVFTIRTGFKKEDSYRTPSIEKAKRYSRSETNVPVYNQQTPLPSCLAGNQTHHGTYPTNIEAQPDN
ncbi:hypothetical protein [Parabacteroides sp.]|uniref:hypothetical protein n=1 Tax=Parabacteroides sp. TaxID=1869337 RepID=UPI00257EAF4D|nr:hypothetical protein [Parabacteroides sp.]